jgi:ATP-dependent RNA helicase SUPV3L1/SUV3
MKSLDQAARAQLRRYGVRFGAFNIYFPLLVKPASTELALALWWLRHGTEQGLSADSPPEPPRPGLTSVAVNPSVPEAFYRACGFHVCGPRAIRVDILERLADLIRPLLAWRPSPDGASTPPKGSTGDGGFRVTPEMMSILGCSPDELSNVLKSLGFRLERRPVPQAPAPAASVQSAAASDPPAASTKSPPEGGGSAPPVGSAEPSSLMPTPSTVPAAAAEPEAERAVAPDGDASASQPEPAAAAQVREPSSEAKEGEERAIRYEEVWRPRRKGNQDRPESRRNRFQQRREREPKRAAAQEGTSAPDQQQAAAAADSRPERTGDQDRAHRHRGRHRSRRKDEHRTGGDYRRADERPGRQMRSAPPKRGEVDPDSPFAALGALKIALEKRAQEQGSS